MKVIVYEKASYIKEYPFYDSRRFSSQKDEYSNIEYTLDIVEKDLIIVENETGYIQIIKDGMLDKRKIKFYKKSELYTIL